MKLKRILLNGFLGAVVLLSCNGNQAKKNNQSNSSPKDSIQNVAKNEPKMSHEMFQLNETAKFIAGMNVDTAGHFYKYSKTGEWKKYHLMMDSIFNHYEENASKAVEWRDREINDLKKIPTVFYPFSGPDFLYVNILFPDAKKYILIGLEGCGSVPQIDSVKEKSLGVIFKGFHRALHDIMKLSFFVTWDMTKDLANQTVDGTTPIICLFMARTNKVIVDVTPMKINAKGEIDSLAKGEKFQTVVNKVMSFRFHDKGSKEIKTLYYLSNNLGSTAMSRNKPFTTFIEHLDSANTVTLLKSAQYLPHQVGFKTIRSLVLSRSKAILQDDTGIPYNGYDTKKWNVTVFGVYTKPIQSFANFYQQDMFDAFKKSAKPLNFRIGYGKVYNLELARKK